MPSLKFYFFSILQALLISYFLFRTTPKMTTTSPSGTKPWADQPCKLVKTPQYTTKKDDMFTAGATHMAHIHNSIFRGYNSIYLQALHVKDVDKAAFIGYALTWFRFVKSHHDDEEEGLFPKVEEVLKDKEIWKETHLEHESFLPGLVEYEKYLSNLSTPSDFDGKELQSIMKSFETPFSTHFHNEIALIASFADHPNAPTPGSQEEQQVAATFKAWGKKTVMKAGTLDVVPFFLMNLDAEYEDGMWKNWPPMPGFVKWGLVNVAGSYYWSWWKFASCGGDGRARELWALGNDGN